MIRELGSESLARHHLFPRSLFRTVGEEEGLISGIGNITLISPSLNSELSDKPPCRVPPPVRRGAEEALHTGG